VLPHLRPGARVLDVGAGKGELVRALRSQGFDARGIDKESGVDFLRFSSSEKFDAILFITSLHHLDPLSAGIEKAHSLLSANGLLLADEFDLASADAQNTARWMEIKQKHGDPMHAFHQHMAHHGVLANAAQMRTAIARRFEILDEWRWPYLFRFQHDGDASLLLREEREKKYTPLGWRVVARAR
jgi:SAM-dependent methyltransferase